MLSMILYIIWLEVHSSYTFRKKTSFKGDYKPQSKDIKYNTMIGSKINITMWIGGATHMGLPPVFYCPEIVMVCIENYDENRKESANKNI